MRTSAKKCWAVLLSALLLFTLFTPIAGVLTLSAKAAEDDSTLVGQYFTTSSYSYDAVTKSDGVAKADGGINFSHNLGLTYFNRGYARLTNENLFADVTRDTGVAFAFNYRPVEDVQYRHILSIGQNARNVNDGNSRKNHLFVSGARTQHHNNLVQVTWVNGSGTELINAYAENLPQVIGREYNVVVSIDKDSGVVFYVDGVKMTTAYANSNLNDQLGNVRSFLDEVHNYKQNYVGCSRWDDPHLMGYLSDLRVYRAAVSSDTEAYDIVSDMATVEKTFNDGGALLGEYFSTDNVWFDAARGENGVQWQVGDFPVYHSSDGWTSFNNSMYVRLSNENLFANVTRDTGLTFAFDYVPNFSGQHRHIISLGQNAYGDGTENQFFISGTDSWYSSGKMPVVAWMNGGSEVIRAYPDGVTPVQGKEYSVVVSIDKDAGVVFYIDGVKRNTVYVDSDLNGQIGNIRSFLDAVHNYKQNYIGCSRWTGDAKIDGLLRDVCIYKDVYTDDEVRAMLADRSSVAVDLTAPAFNAPAYHYTDVANGGYANLAYASPASDADSGMGIRGADGNDNYKNIGGANLKLFTQLQAVLVYDGARETYAPVQLESKSANQTNISKSRIRYARSGSDKFALKNDWQGYRDAEWKKWAADYTNTAASFSSVSSTESDYLVDNKNTPRFFWNALKYTGTGDTQAYWERVQNVRYDFKVYYDLSVGGTGDGYDSITTNSDYYILNYRPVYDVLSAANALNGGALGADAWMYTEKSLAQAKLAMRRLTLSNPNLYDYEFRGVDNSTQWCAAAIKQAAADYAAIDLVKKTGNVVFQKEDGTPIITIYNVNYGEGVPAGSVPAIPAKDFDDTNHYADARWDTDFSSISQPETVVKATYTAVAHDMVTDAAVPANCSETGLTEGAHCADCGYAIPQTTVPILPDAHDFSVFVETVAPTCAAGGYDVYKCSRCDATTHKNETAIDPNAHDFSVFVETVAPTCAAGGYDVYKCSRCDATTHKNETAIDPNAHDFSVFVETVAPTCAAGGYDVYKCSRCDVTTNKNETAIDPNAHDFSVFVETVAPTCAAGGYDVYKCSRCDATTNKNETAADPTAHDFSVLKKDADGHWYQCARCDAVTDSVAHTGGMATCTEKAVCEVCGTAYGEYGDHSYGAWIAEAPATCTADGVKGHYHCDACSKDFDADKNELADLVIPAAHTYGSWIAEQPATCAAEGVKGHYHCSACGKDFDADKNELADLTLAKVDHVYGDWYTVGDGTHACECKNCSEGTEGHMKTEACHGGTATCTEQALCEVCLGRYGDLADHSLGAWIEAIPNGCFTDGVLGHFHCDACGKDFDADKNELESLTVPAVGSHTLMHVPAKNAGCPNTTGDGHIEYWRCSVCGKYFSDEACAQEIYPADARIPAAHRPVFVAEKPATATANGVKAHYDCSLCGKHYSDEACTHELTDEDLMLPATGETPQGDCPLCGKYHDGSIWGRVSRLVHMIVYIFLSMFGKV